MISWQKNMEGQCFCVCFAKTNLPWSWVEDAGKQHGDKFLMCVGCCFKAFLKRTAGQQGNLAFVYACACVCRRVPQVVASCRSAGHVALMWNCQQLPWQREGKQKLSAPGVRERRRRRNEAQTFSQILSTSRRFFCSFLTLAAFSLSLVPSC